MTYRPAWRPRDDEWYSRIGSEDAEQASWLSDVLERRIRYDHTAARWHIFDPETGIWKPDKTREAQRIVTEVAYDAVAAAAQSGLPDKQRQEVEKRIRRLFNVAQCEQALKKLSERPEYKTDGADWDQNPFLLGCENGIVDLRQNALIPDPGPELLVTKSTGIPFRRPMQDFGEMRKRCPIFARSLEEWTSEDPEMVGFFLLWFGYSLFGLNTEQKFLLMTGLGRNGKGALATIMRHVFGEYNAEVDGNLYMRSRFGAARTDGARADLMTLKGKRLAIMSEPSGGAFDEETLKAHTGGDPITARALYSNNVISWAPTHSINFLTNEPPKVNDIGPSMASRVMVADFRERFDGDKENKKLYDQLRAEGEGVLAALILAASLWWDMQDNGKGLVLPERVKRVSEEYMEASDPIGNALLEAFVIEPGARSAGKMLYDAYKDWHLRDERDDEPLTATAFGIALGKKGIKRERTRTGTVYTGIRPRGAWEMAE